MVISVSIHNSVNKLFMSQCFQQNVLTFMQMRADEKDSHKLQIKIRTYK